MTHFHQDEIAGKRKWQYEHEKESWSLHFKKIRNVSDGERKDNDSHFRNEKVDGNLSTSSDAGMYGMIE